MLRAVLKLPWRSPRGKLYPAGTIFTRKREFDEGCWYDYQTPNSGYGFVYLKNSIFKRPSSEELEIRKKRIEAREEHIKKTNSLLEFS